MDSMRWWCSRSLLVSSIFDSIPSYCPTSHSATANLALFLLDKKIRKKMLFFFLSRFILWCSASSEATVHHSAIDWLIDCLVSWQRMRSSFALPWLPQLDSFFLLCFVVFRCVYLVWRGRLSRSLTSCFRRNTVSCAPRRLWEKSTFWMAELVERVKASPSRGTAGTALDLTNSGAVPAPYLRSCLAGKWSQDARPKLYEGMQR